MTMSYLDPHSEKNGIRADVDERVPPCEDSFDFDPVYNEIEQRKIIHRVDRRLVPALGLLYCFSLIDRTNLASASIAALVFFITYILFQPLAVISCRKFGSRPFLAAITLSYGIVMIGFGFTKDWITLVPLRLLLGVFEAGSMPGSIYLISTWYSRYDVQKRYSVFYLISCIAAASSGILALGFMKMNGLAHMAGWRWIFIMCGILTCVAAVVGYIFLGLFLLTQCSWYTTLDMPVL